MEKTLTIDDFELLDAVQFVDGRTPYIGIKNKEGFITRSEAFKAYKEGKLIRKTVEFEGEQIFIDIWPFATWRWNFITIVNLNNDFLYSQKKPPRVI